VIFWIGFHGGRKGNISLALKKFPAREKKKERNFRRGLERKYWEKKNKKEEEEEEEETSNVKI
jgi:hypothetical protein